MSVCKYRDQAWIDGEWQPRRCWRKRGHAGSHFRTVPARDFADVIAGLRQAREAAAVQAEEADALPVEVVQEWAPVDPDTIVRRSPKRVIRACRLAGFTVEAATTRTFERGKTYKSGQKAGQKTPDKEVEHLWVRGRVPGVAGFLAFYVDGGRFESAFVWDAAGWPRELWADYEPDHVERSAKGWSKERGEAEAARLSGEYNDGEFWVDHAPRLVSKGSEFDEWLGDLIPGFNSPAKKATKIAKHEGESMEVL